MVRPTLCFQMPHYVIVRRAYIWHLILKHCSAFVGFDHRYKFARKKMFVLKK